MGEESKVQPKNEVLYVGIGKTATWGTHLAKKRYIAGIDGLRVLAIIAVIIFHANPTWLPGGYAGVTLFFVITGYLLTASVDRALAEKGSFDYLDNVRRRITRLLPSMLCVVGIVALASLIAARPLLEKMKDDAVPALLFFQNWYYIVRNVSYFAAAGLPSPLTHFWYLSIVMQFSIIWPLLLMVFDKIGMRRRHRAIICAVLAVASQIAMAVLYDPAADTNRVYYGLDTRAGELLVGALVAQLAPILSSPVKAAGTRRSRNHASTPLVSDTVLTVAGLLGLAFFAIFSVMVNGYSPFPYYGGFLLLALASGALVLSVVRETTMISRFFGLAPIAGLGKRSFALYLWHYPLLLIMNPATRTTEVALWERALQFAIILVTAELSYRIFEAKRVKTVEQARRYEAREISITGIPQASRVLSVLGVIAALILFIAPANTQQTGEVAQPEPEAQTQPAEEPETDPETERRLAASRERVFYPVEGTIFQGTPFQEAIERINEFTFYDIDPETGATNAPVILVGDSVPLGAETQFYEMFPYGHMDAEVSRSIYAGKDVLQSLWDQGIDGDIVVWALGNNAVCYEEDVRAVIEMCGDRRVYLVTARVPLALQDMNNALFYEVAEDYKNCSVIDWYGTSAGHDEYFWDDGTHLRPEGAEAYCLMLREAIVGR